MTKLLTVLTVLFVMTNPVFAGEIPEEVQAAAAMLPTTLPAHLQTQKRVTVVHTTERGQPKCHPGMVCEDEVIPAPPVIARIAEDDEPAVVFSASTGAAVGCLPGFDCSKRESFWSFTNISFGILQFGSGALDTKTTMDAIALNGTYDIQIDGVPYEYTVNFYEESGPDTWFVNKGTAALSGYKFALNTGIWVGSLKLRQSNNKFFKVLGYVIPIAVSAYQFNAGLQNQREIDRVNDRINGR